MQILAMVALGVLGVAEPPSPTAAACACSGCGRPGDARWGLEHSAAVFTGTVMVTRLIPERYFGVEGPGGRRSAPRLLDLLSSAEVRLAVDSVWKGIDSAEAVVYTVPDADGCGVEFVVGHRYLVFARRNERGELVTWLCDGTREAYLKQAVEDRRVLGTGRAVAQARPDARP